MEQQRLHGFRLSKKEIEERNKIEQRRKWNEKLERVDVVKLRTELESLNRASFLTPQQNERKRLVSRMVSDLEQRARVASDMQKESQLDPQCRNLSISTSSSEDYDDLFGRARVDSTVRDSFPTKAFQLLPRSLRKRNNEGALIAGGDKKRAKMAEDALLSSSTVGDNIEEFFDSL
ncbi:hypothetical protein TcG_09327 [Trypanosoma cruzi]|nr:hypothetical protein TcG_09327 [Trypanosoma cruzi]